MTLSIVVAYNQENVKPTRRNLPIENPTPGAGLGDVAPAESAATPGSSTPNLAPVSPFLDRLVTIDQLTRYYITLSPSTIAKLVRDGVLPVVRIGDSVRFHPRTVLSILLQRGTITTK